MDNWISVKEKLPKQNGQYLCCVRVSFGINDSFTYMQILDFATNLYSVDEYDFYDSHHPGFYYTNDDMSCCHEVDDVEYWMPLPKLPSVK